MKYKKSMIILITTIFLFSIASACASDTNTTTMAVADEQTTEEINEIEADNPASDDSKILGSSAGNEILKSSTTVTNHTFDAIESAITEGYNTIHLEPGTHVVKFEIENTWCPVRKEVFRLWFLQVIPENTWGSNYTDNTGSLRRFGIPEGLHPVIEITLGGAPEEST